MDATISLYDSVMGDDALHESSNVFADLGFADPVMHKLKAELVSKLDNILKVRGLSESAAAKRVGISQSDLSMLLTGRFREVSVELLLRILTRLECEIDIGVQFEGKTVGDTIHLKGGVGSPSTLDAWLKREAAVAYDRLMADPSRALSADEVRASLATEYQLKR